MIRHKTLNTAIDTILKQQNEDRCWSLYLAVVANPFSEETSFDDFLAKQTGKKQNKSSKVKSATMNSKQMSMQVVKADKILSNFTPTKRGGTK